MTIRLGRASPGILVSLAVIATPAAADIIVPATADPLLSGLAIPADASQKGMWSPVKNWPLVGLHASVMPTGLVMTYGSPLGNGVQDGRTFDIWDPARGLDDPAAHYTLANAQAVDSFCSTATFLTTGAMLISGGNTPASGFSSLASTAFNPATNTPSSVASQLAYPRWYASMITLADGRALIAGGAKPYVTGAYLDVANSLARGDVSMTPEVYAPGTGWSKLTGATSRDAFGPDFNRWWYPRMWVVPGGKVFGISADRTWLLDPTGYGSIRTLSTFKSGYDANRKPNTGPTSTAVMYDVGKILQVGGNGAANGQATPSSAAATIFDVRSGTPVATETTAMNYPRQWPNATVLPNGQVVVTGGTRFGDNAGTDAVYPAEIWNPATGRWTVAASAAVYRGYHSAAILLPNGTVLSTGGGVPGPATNFNAEIYYPPYLFTTSGNGTALARRPVVTSYSGNVPSYGGAMTITLADTTAIRRVVVVGASSTTHSFNTGQRLIDVNFTQSGNRVTATMPKGSDIAPPGYYLVFAIDGNGVPANGLLVSLGGTQAPPAKPAGRGTIWASIGVASERVARGADGTLAIVNVNGDIWRYRADNSWAKIDAPVPMKDVAVVGANSIYAIGTNGLVYRFGGRTWAVVGRAATAIGAASDGTVVVVSVDASIWRKAADDDVENWSRIPGTAARVSPINGKSFWMVGTDGNVYRGVGSGPWTQVGVRVKDISTSPDGHVAVVNSDDGTIWTKPQDSATAVWSSVSFVAKSVAAADGGALVTVAPNGQVYRN